MQYCGIRLMFYYFLFFYSFLLKSFVHWLLFLELEVQVVLYIKLKRIIFKLYDWWMDDWVPMEKENRFFFHCSFLSKKNWPQNSYKDQLISITFDFIRNDQYKNICSDFWNSQCTQTFVVISDWSLCWYLNSFVPYWLYG